MQSSAAAQPDVGAGRLRPRGGHQRVEDAGQRSRGVDRPHRLGQAGGRRGSQRRGDASTRRGCDGGGGAAAAISAVRRCDLPIDVGLEGARSGVLERVWRSVPQRSSVPTPSRSDQRFEASAQSVSANSIDQQRSSGANRCVEVAFDRSGLRASRGSAKTKLAEARAKSGGGGIRTPVRRCKTEGILRCVAAPVVSPLA